ncbi:MAG: 3-dehydroquinate synthase [Pyrinomonadaceae bacterium]
MSKTVKIKLKGKPENYEIKIGHGFLENCGDQIRNSPTEMASKIAIVSNRKVFRLYGKAVENSLKKSGFKVFVRLIGDGEKYKNFSVLEKTLKFFSENKLTRTDAILALGGGVVGDLTGFAASVYLRGISFIQMPTTLLSMIDSSVGGKTAVNSRFGKNLIGTFYQPDAVLIDPQVLQTLAPREITAGFCEAVKQGAISGQNLFNQTADFLKKYPVENFKKYSSDENFHDDLQNLLASQIAFKAKIVAGDEYENVNRTDFRSRKILNFGHTIAHALEKITDYSYFKHGEAVGYGILAAGEISKTVANFNQNELKSLNDVVRMTGTLPAADNIETEKIIQAFAFDKKQIGESLQWILLEAIGKPKILQNRDIPNQVIKKSLEKVLKNK